MSTISQRILYWERDSIHGWICIYVRNDVKSFVVLNNSEDKRSVEQIWCGISSYDEKVLVGCIYRPSNSDPRVFGELLIYIKKAKNKID